MSDFFSRYYGVKSGVEQQEVYESLLIRLEEVTAEFIRGKAYHKPRHLNFPLLQIRKKKKKRKRKHIASRAIKEGCTNPLLVFTHKRVSRVNSTTAEIFPIFQVCEEGREKKSMENRVVVQEEF